MKGLVCLVIFFIGVSNALPFDFAIESDANFGLCDNTAHGVYEYPGGDCSRYILCLFHKEVEVKCDDDTIFDLKLRDCVRGNQQTCEAFTVPPSTTTTTTTTFSPPTTPDWRDNCEPGQTGNVEYPDSCKIWIYCLEGFGSLRICGQGEIFIYGRCVPGDIDTCEPYE